MPVTKERILIVDDTPQNLQVLSGVLKEKGYLINVAGGGQQALQVVEKVLPQLILLDIMMPDMDGYETCRRLKAMESTRDIPVIFLTAKVETEDVVKGFETGAVDYIAKPFHATELIARVSTHLTLYRLKRELAEELQRTKALQETITRLRQGQETYIQQQLNSHLAIVRAYSSLLKDGHGEGLNDRQKLALSRIAEDSQRMVRVLGQWQQVQALETGSFVLEKTPADLDALLQQIAGEIETATARKVVFQFNNLTHTPVAAVDIRLVPAALEGLFRTSVELMKEAPFESDRRVEVSLAEADHLLTLSLYHPGLVLSEENLTGFFDQFQTPAHDPSTGLGANLAYWTAKAHGGDVSVTCQPGIGTWLRWSLARE